MSHVQKLAVTAVVDKHVLMGDFPITFSASVDGNQLEEFNKRILAASRSVFLEISRRKSAAYPCMRRGNIPSVDAIYSETTG
ncbi:hypothetical protein T12_15080 [Trichinella patagoniensis]|uniref:Uncharacterized protein n=1 Tax=Trichinella patagoniensis TaxID=990121 RepID=A0A0V0Z0J3_9BILA|nr:hypothetical protein T12_15080 [Trichinella patagoniensis]